MDKASGGRGRLLVDGVGAALPGGNEQGVVIHHRALHGLAIGSAHVVLGNAGIIDGARLARPAADDGTHETSVLPLLIYLEIVHSTQSAHVACLPQVGQGGQELQRVGVTLQKHLGHTGTGTEVAVDLEGRMGVEEIVIDSALVRLYVITGRVPQGIVQDDVGVVAVQCAGPQTHLPSHAPAGGLVATQAQRVDSSGLRGPMSDRG